MKVYFCKFMSENKQKTKLTKIQCKKTNKKQKVKTSNGVNTFYRHCIIHFYHLLVFHRFEYLNLCHKTNTGYSYCSSFVFKIKYNEFDN